MKLETLFLDLDGVLVDFFSASLRLHDRADLFETYPTGEWNIPQVMGIDKSDFWKKIDDAGPEWWATLAKYSWCDDLVAACEEVAPTFIATSPSLHPHSSHGKVLWLNEHLRKEGKSTRKYILSEHKQLLARPGRVLIDDSDSNVEKFREAGGHAILFPQHWNSLHQINMIDRVWYVRDELRKIEDELRNIEAIT